MYDFRAALIKELINRGNDVTILTPFDSHVDDLRALGATLVETPVDRRGTNPVRDLGLIKLYKRELKRIAPDLVITYTIKPNVYGCYAAKGLKIPYAMNITGLGTAFENEGLLKKMVVAMYKLSAPKAKVVFFENSANRDTFVNEGIIPESKTHVLHGAGVDVNRFSYQEYPADAEVTRFLFIGRVMKEKGIEELFSAMRQLVAEGEKTELHVVGGFEENYKATIDQYEAEGWLHYHGHQNDVRPFIGQCHCFVLPSYHEGMANTNLESASSGRPLITSDIPGCREAVVENVSGLLCEPKDAENLYGVMKRFLALSRDERKAMGLAGREHMIAVFDKQKVVEETAEEIVGS